MSSSWRVRSTEDSDDARSVARALWTMSPKSMMPTTRSRSSRSALSSAKSPWIDLASQPRPGGGDALLVAIEQPVDDGAMPRIGDRRHQRPQPERVLGVPQEAAAGPRVEEATQGDAEAGQRLAVSAQCAIVEVAAGRGCTAGHPLEQPHEVAALGALGGRPVGGRVRLVVKAQRELRPGDRQVGVGTADVQDCRGLQVEHRGVLAQVRDLDHASRAAVVDHERLVALAAQIACLAVDAVQLEGDRGHLGGGEPGRRRLEDAGGAGCRLGHAVDRLPATAGEQRTSHSRGPQDALDGPERPQPRCLRFVQSGLVDAVGDGQPVASARDAQTTAASSSPSAERASGADGDSASSRRLA